ncbi:MAG: transporter [Epsilonproteobacteria bacterium (ex Lamellibrachia satsuma)]|nr:MAG: transporter [Epsilonproteobacteria bacterium (ex Lamellibrachia satsuma)]
MFIKRTFLLLTIALPLFAGVKHLSLPHAIEILKKDNLELKISRFNEQMKIYEAKAAKGMNYGKLDATLMAMRSNDAGNVFGFKLQSREATFGDFGFSEFDGTNPNILNVQPADLNYPEARNHFLTKFSYMLPLYTGGKLTEYGHITESLYRMSQYDTQKLLNAKIFQTKKAFYDISLVENYITNLSKIIRNISKLEAIVKNMKKEGYAKDVDLLEVQARRAEAKSMYNQAKLNKDLAYQFLSFLLNTEVGSIKHLHDMAPMPRVNRKALEANNIDIQKAKLGLHISKRAVKVQKANFLPEVGAFAEYGSADNELWNEFRKKDSYTVGVQVKWNLFNGGVDNANLEKAKVNYMLVQDQVRLAKSGIALKVKKLRTEVLSANADIQSYKKQLRFARRVYENYRARYEEGMVSISDVLIKQSKELEMLLKLLTAKNKRNTKVFELDSILNRGENV